MQGDFVNTLIGLCEVFSFWVNFCTFLTWRIWFLHIQRNFVEKVALLHQIWKIKILNHQISATGSRLQYVANRYREGFWKFSMFWCILQICLNLLVDDCQFNYITNLKKKKETLAVWGGRAICKLITYLWFSYRVYPVMRDLGWTSTHIGNMVKIQKSIKNISKYYNYPMLKP